MSSTKSCGCGQPGCDCCAGVERLTPRPIANRPGLASIAWRIGTHGAFLQTMKARLSTHRLADAAPGADRPLAALATRAPADPAIAMLDAWATVGDVLSFYQERIANEGFLRTATERRSVRELARLVGYQPRPGVAASVYLAYTIDAKTKDEVVVGKGARSQSVPGPGELPQSFETSEELRARAAWNLLKPRTTQPQRFATVMSGKRLYLPGVASTLKVGDPLLMVEAGHDAELLRITAVEAEMSKDRTRIGFERWKDSGLPKAHPVLRLLDQPQTGKLGPPLVERLQAVRKHLSETHAPLPRAITERAFLDIDETRKQIGGLRAEKFRAWLDELSTAILAASNKDKAPIASVVAKLAERPSKPLPNALQLRRSLESSSRKISDAGLQMLTTIAPQLHGTIGPALTGIVDSTNEPTLEVFAFRVRAGVFGRNVPKRQKIVRGLLQRPEETHTEIVGEWPIVETEDVKPVELNAPNAAAAVPQKVKSVKESSRIVHLETSHDGILPGSWVVFDSSAVQQAGEAMVEPADDQKPEGILITTVKSVQSKVARAEYGSSGDTTRLELGSPWIHFNEKWLELENGEPMIDKPLKGEPIEDPEKQLMSDRDFQVIRATTVFTQSEKLVLAEEPIEKELCGGAAADEPIELDGLYQDLQPGRFVVVSGQRHGFSEETVVEASEPLMISDVVHDVRSADDLVPLEDARNAAGSEPPKPLPGDRIHTFVRFDRPLRYCYRRETVRIDGNVVKATHGETREETLGGGDGSKPLQSFVLKQAPLTYLAAPTAAGAESSLQVFVNDLRWRERVSFVDALPTDRIFVTRADDEGKTTLVFGNGREGARLPTGLENVKAGYRNGIGSGGNVRAGQISQLSTRPLGVKEVINPLRASGGADAESRDQARRNAPNAVMALDRLVATRDYADFARSFAGIAKAQAVEVSDGRRNVVHVTIAGTDDIPIDRGSDLFINLQRAFRDLGDPFQPVELATRELLVLVIDARIRVSSEHRWEAVATELRAKLIDAFGFEKRELGQDVAASEVIGVMQAVRGVEYVDLDVLGALPSMVDDADGEDGRRPATPEEIAAVLKKVLDDKKKAPPDPVSVELARRDEGRLRPAQLAVLLPDVPATLVLNPIA